MENDNQIVVADANTQLAKHDKFTRRGFLGLGMATLAVAGIAPAMRAADQDRSTSDPGPGNPALDAENPDSAWPPSTDSKSLVPNFKYSFSLEDNLAAQRLLANQYDAESDALLAARKQLAVANVQYRDGLITYLNVATADSTELNVEFSTVQIRGQQLVASVALVKALGGGWQASASHDRVLKQPRER